MAALMAMPLARTSSRRNPGKSSVMVEGGPQFGFHYLAIVVLRQAFDEAIFARPLEARDVVEAQAVELLRGRRRAARHHEGDHHLAPLAGGAAGPPRPGPRPRRAPPPPHPARVDVGS